MRKTGYDIFKKMIMSIVLVFSMISLTGCSDSELEQKNRQLEKSLVQKRTYSSALEARLEKTEMDKQKIQKELSILRENNKGLNVSLAKSELLFSQKHKVELEVERKRLDSERESFKKERTVIEKEAYTNAEEAVTSKYFGVLVVVSILSVFLLILWFFTWKKSRRELKALTNTNKKLENEKVALNNDLNTLVYEIEDLKRKEKEGSKNQVVGKIEENEARRQQLLHSVGGIDRGN